MERQIINHADRFKYSGTIVTKDEVDSILIEKVRKVFGVLKQYFKN